MKTNVLKFFTTVFMFLSVIIYAQTEIPIQHTSDLPTIIISDEISLHIISPEPIQFVDLSSDDLVGDLPSQNIARVKLHNTDENKRLRTSDKIGIITVVGQSYMAQYSIVYSNFESSVTNIQIQPTEMQPLDNLNSDLSNTELKKLAQDILKTKAKNPIRKAKGFKVNFKLNNVYVRDDYIFFDLSISNSTNVPYSIENISFSIDDKKIYKATNNQSISVKPIYSYSDQKGFRKKYRNIYVFKKFTYPNSKVLRIRLTEKQVSGRTVELEIKYKDVLNADLI
ncbi:MAG: conjugative transposon protein TraN [Weeksellaceae bacterium]|nr:conjugative transposon protein TraN [Acholeplasmataceae bacterium]